MEISAKYINNPKQILLFYKFLHILSIKFFYV